MARLNEPAIAPAPTATATGLVNGVGVGAAGAENIEILKRRFIRQNRELAKNNSAQSLRIRSLELEVSKLLSDNSDLRQLVLGLKNELYTARSRASTEAARKVKNDLKVKLTELSGIIDTIDEEGSVEREVPDKARILSPSRRQYRERQPLADLMRDTQMPAIEENKSFPRRTLDERDIREIRLSDQSGASGSPDIGPPPVAHFEDLPKLDNQEDETVTAGSNEVDDELLPSINLETRRKRKDPGQPNRRSSILALSPDKADGEAPSTMLRTGAKRKLADRESEKTIRPPTQEDFTFSRKLSAAQLMHEEAFVPIMTQQAGDAESTIDTDVRPQSPTKPGRKVLANKSTNMSPMKTSNKPALSLQDDLKKPAGASGSANKTRAPARSSRRVSSTSAIPLPPTQDHVIRIAEILPPRPSSAEPIPMTPAALEVFSPPQSDYSDHQQDARDTPPPADLSSVSNTTEGGQRPSRRARSAVNYAEPSLVAKMRRPDKKMVDAVNGLQDPRRSMSSSAASADGKKRTVTGTVKVKSEPSEEVPSAFKGLPHTSSLSRESMGSPLRHLTTDDHPSPLVSPTRPSSASDNDHLASTSTRTQGISTLIANSRKRREALDRRLDSPPRSAEEQISLAAKKMEELELYDFKDSSSPNAAGADAEDKNERETKTATGIKGTHRRHSSVPKAAEGSFFATGGRTVMTTATMGHGARMASRRRSMML